MFNLLINFYYTLLESISNFFFLLNFLLNLHSNDAPYPWQIAFQDPASPGFIGRATARVCTELLKLKIKDNPEEWAEDLNTNFITVKGEGQEPVLKGAMRLKIARGLYLRAKMSFEVIRSIRMRLNYQISRIFG